MVYLPRTWQPQLHLPTSIIPLLIWPRLLCKYFFMSSFGFSLMNWIFYLLFLLSLAWILTWPKSEKFTLKWKKIFLLFLSNVFFIITERKKKVHALYHDVGIQLKIECFKTTAISMLLLTVLSANLWPFHFITSENSSKPLNTH